MGYIYKITSPSGKAYIGRTNNIYERIRCYKYLKCKTQPKIYNSLKKYGFDNHKFEIILKTEDTINAEVKLIQYFDSFNNGLNLTEGGEGCKMTYEIRRKISEFKKGKPSPRKGVVLSEETKVKMSKSFKGRPSHQRKAIIEITKTGDIIEWPSQSHAARFYNLCSATIHYNVNHSNRIYNNSRWMYKNQYNA